MECTPTALGAATIHRSGLDLNGKLPHLSELLLVLVSR